MSLAFGAATQISHLNGSLILGNISPYLLRRGTTKNCWFSIACI